MSGLEFGPPNEEILNALRLRFGSRKSKVGFLLEVIKCATSFRDKGVAASEYAVNSYSRGQKELGKMVLQIARKFPLQSGSEHGFYMCLMCALGSMKTQYSHNLLMSLASFSDNDEVRGLAFWAMHYEDQYRDFDMLAKSLEIARSSYEIEGILHALSGMEPTSSAFIKARAVILQLPESSSSIIKFLACLVILEDPKSRAHIETLLIEMDQDLRSLIEEYGKFDPIRKVSIE